MTAIDTTNLTKRYGDVTALSGLDLEVKSGEIYGFLGPNGAGKSTTIDTLLDFVRPTSGTARVFGLDAQDDSLEIRRRVGTLPDGYRVYDRLTGRQHVRLAIDAKDADDSPRELLERVGIADAIDRKAGGYSKGMTQRLLFGAALAGDPELLILDEPSSGLDPTSTREMRRIIREENERGTTVFFSSHILGQVEAVCDRVGILRGGELIAEDTIGGLREATSAETGLSVEVDHVPADMDEIRALSGVSGVEVDGNSISISCDDGSKLRVLNAIEMAGASVLDFTTRNVSLEEVFMAYTGDAPSDTSAAGEGQRKRSLNTETGEDP